MHKISDEFEFRLDRTTNYGKFPIDLNGKMVSHASSFIFYRIIIKVAGNQDRYKSSVEFDFGLVQTIHFGVICP